MDTTNKNILFRLVDDEKTYYDVGEPENILKTAIVMNVLMIIVTVTMCFVPIPFMAPVVIISYIISFCVLNIKFMSDFAMAIYQVDNKQIQNSKIKYSNSTNKISDVSTKVVDKLEKDYQKLARSDEFINKLYEDVMEQLIKSHTLMTENINSKIAEGKTMFEDIFKPPTVNINKTE